MRSTPSNSDPEVRQPLTRQLQNWKWPRREPTGSTVAPETPCSGPICLSTVVLGDVILDFESFILVIGGRRLFPKVPHFWIASALLFADGDEVSTTSLYALRSGTGMRHSSSLVARDIRALNATVFAHDPRMRVSATGRGYRLTWDGPMVAPGLLPPS